MTGKPSACCSILLLCTRISSWTLAPAVRASGVFEEPTITRRLFEVTFTADGYATNLSTQSGVKELPENARADLVARVHQRVQEHGGRVTAHLLAMLTVARRAENPRP